MASAVFLASLTPAKAAPMTQARLVVASETARPGDTVLAGVHLRMPPRWHTYWRTPGESGTPIAVEWVLPKGIQAGELQWPPPERLVSGGLTTFVYAGETVLLATLKIATDAPPGPVELGAKVTWLECDELCVQGEARVRVGLTIGGETKPAGESTFLENWRKRVPGAEAALAATARWGDAIDKDTLAVVIEGATKSDFHPSDFLPYGAPGAEISPAVTLLSAEPGRFRLQKTMKRFEQTFPARVAGLLIQFTAAGHAEQAFEVSLELGTPPAGRASATLAAPTGPGVSASATPQRSLWRMLGLAFLGGLILNIMPCVLPVIALKVLGFVSQSREAPERVRRLGFVYAAGVIVSFLALAVMVITVQRAGGAASWGMQMQNPQFRLALTVLVTLVALNLFGLFEVSLGSGAMTAAAGLAAKEGAPGAFFNGVLTVALATPCTAPWLTVALGFAFTQTPLVIAAMFLASGLGLAAPYLVLSCRPNWLKFLPKPGAWMVRFKVAMGFPMLATAVWLFDLTAPSFGEGGGLWLGVFLVVLALAAWVWGEFRQRDTRRSGWGLAACVALLALDYGGVLERQLRWRTPTPRSAGTGIIRDSPEGIAWRPWSTAAVDEFRAQGHPVLVDFTAKWCLTCRTNKKLAIDIPSVRAKLKALNAVAFRADNTDPSPAIAAELKRYERAGVPLVLVFPAKPDRSAIVLPALLTPGLVLEALEKAGQG